MAKYDEAVIENVLSIFREYLKTKKVNLSPKDREDFMQYIKMKEFRCADDRYGIVHYRGWVIPYILNEHPTKDLNQIGEGLDKESRKIFQTIRAHTFAHALADIWSGNLNDILIIHAMLVEIGRHSGVMPIIDRQPKHHPPGVDWKVNDLALQVLQHQEADNATH